MCSEEENNEKFKIKNSKKTLFKIVILKNPKHILHALVFCLHVDVLNIFKQERF